MADSTSQLCWNCQNATPDKEGTRGCSWSRELIPVKGAIIAKSGKITYCPEFILDPPSRSKK